MSFNGNLLYQIYPSNDIDLNNEINSNGNDGLISLSNDIDLDGKYYVKYSELFDLIEKIELRLENLTSKFSLLKYEKNKEIVYNKMSFYLKDIANELRKFKNDLKK